MAMKPYPTNTLIFNIDQSLLDDSMKLAMRRSWTHVGDFLVRPCDSPAEEAAESYLHVMVKFGARPYLKAGEESDANWSERMEQHILATLRKVSSNLVAFNRNQRKNGDPELQLDRIEFSLEQGALTLEFLPDSNGTVPEQCAKAATQIRAALNRGDLGSPVRVRVPSRASFAAQTAIAAEAAATNQEEAPSEEEAAPDAQEAPAFAEDPDLARQLEEEEKARLQEEQPVSPLEVAPLTPEQWEAAYGVPAVDFEVDYSIGEAIDADGTSRQFVVATGKPVDAEQA